MTGPVDPGPVARDLGLAPGPETDRIAALVEAATAAGARVGVGIGDDAALLDVPAGSRIALSSDASVEDVHFRREWMTWEVIGFRAVAGALSDLAAMAAAPLGALLSVALPPELDASVAGALGRGVGACLARCEAALLGGDVVASPGPAMLDVSAVGHVSTPVRRGGAGEGDEIWVTGWLGGAAAAVADLRRGLEPAPEARRAFERPVPRLREARWLAGRAALSAMIDLSDGLARDARHLGRASGAAIDLELARIPASPALEGFRDSEAGTGFLVAGGEDYELLIAAPPGTLSPLAGPFEAGFDLPLTRIGVVRAGSGLRWIGADGTPRPLRATGFEHFGDEAGA